MKARTTAAVLLFCLAGCSRDQPAAVATTTPQRAPAPGITKATFEPVYRAGKTIQGSTGTGVTYQKFMELMQSLSTEIGIAKDHPLNDADKKLLALYEEALHHYAVSASLWKMKIDASDDMWHGEIPVSFSKATDTNILTVIAAYHLPLTDRKVPYTGAKYKAIPGDSVQRVWQHADVALNKATDLYYGR